MFGVLFIGRLYDSKNNVYCLWTNQKIQRTMFICCRQVERLKEQCLLKSEDSKNNVYFFVGKSDDSKNNVCWNQKIQRTMFICCRQVGRLKEQCLLKSEDWKNNVYFFVGKSDDSKNNVCSNQKIQRTMFIFCRPVERLKEQCLLQQSYSYQLFSLNLQRFQKWPVMLWVAFWFTWLSTLYISLIL